MNAATIREKILGADDLPRGKVGTPEWKAAGIEEVTVRAFTAGDLERFEASGITAKATARISELVADGKDLEEAKEIAKGELSAADLAGTRALVCSLAVIDPETGKLVFSEADMIALAGKNAGTLTRIMNEVLALSGYGKKTGEEASSENPFDEGPRPSSSSD